MDKKLKLFIEKLGKTPVPSNACNMFSYSVPQNEIRRSNLLRYFQQMAERRPEVLIVGEAPGYQGMRWTGAPFASEYHLLRGIPEVDMFGEKNGYRKTDEWEKIWKEPSSTIVWGALRSVKRLPLIWASYPYHPHKTGEALTNRAPTNEELVIGRPFILEIMEIFGIKRVLAVGNKAEITLGKLGIIAPKVRHPSHGGAVLFAEGVKKHLV